MSHAFLMALQFLTRIPVPNIAFDAKTQGQSILFYPLIGFMIGIVALTVAYALSAVLPISAVALIVVATSIAITGALHLDGLADSADAWLGSHGDRQRCLDIMHDPACGPAGVIVLVLLILAKFIAYEHLIAQAVWLPIIIAPLLARTAIIALFLTTPYARQDGIGNNIHQYMPKTEAYWTIALSLAITVFIFGGFWSCVCAAILFYFLRRAMLRTLNGTTGDTAGAMVEVIEVGVLIVAMV